jgi:hypothetical protein
MVNNNCHSSSFDSPKIQVSYFPIPPASLEKPHQNKP